MKLTITTLLLFICSLTYGQTYKLIVAEADGFYNSKEYQKSVDKFKEAFKIEQKNAGDFYNAGCAASLLGDKELAFEWLNLAFKNGWTNIGHLKTDSDLISLHDSKKWNNLLTEMQKELEKKKLTMINPCKLYYWPFMTKTNI
jgi:tetratricopeptide (TPR) repeat protein